MFPFGEDVMLPVSFLSGCSLSYLTWSSQGGCTLFIWTGEHVPLRVVNVMWTDLRELDCTRHFWSQIWIILNPIWTYGIHPWGIAYTSNIEILERFQLKDLCMIVDAPWYVPNTVIQRDL
jgi:hypothetical protein